MTAHIAVEFVGDAHHQRQQQQLNQHPQKHIPHREQGKHHGIDQNSHNDHHQQEAGAAAGMVLGLGPYVFHCQLQALLIAKNRLMLRAMVGKYPPDILHPGYQHQIPHKQTNSQQSICQVPQQHAACPQLHKAGQKSGQQHKKAHRKSHSDHHRKGDHQLLHFFIAQLPVQPLLKPGGLLHAGFLRVVVGREHQGLDALDHAVQERHAAPDQGQAQNRVLIPDELELLLPDHQPLGPTDHNGLLLRPPHQNSLDQRLSTNGGTEGAGLLICHRFV